MFWVSLLAPLEVLCRKEECGWSGSWGNVPNHKKNHCPIIVALGADVNWIINYDFGSIILLKIQNNFPISHITTLGGGRESKWEQNRFLYQILQQDIVLGNV